MRIAVLMPTFNESASTLRATLAEVSALSGSLGGIAVYLIDDGSRAPLRLADLPASTGSFDLVLCRHPVNLGQGAGLETARRLALRDPRHQIFVTMDSDGQHLPGELATFAAEIDRGSDVVFGNRFAGSSNVPPVRHVILWLARQLERVLTGLPLSDAHNGYRAFSRRAMERIRIKQNRMAHATEIKQRVALARRDLTIGEVPVSIRYTDETLRKGQSSLGAVRILKDLFTHHLFGPE